MFCSQPWTTHKPALNRSLRMNIMAEFAPFFSTVVLKHKVPRLRVAEPAFGWKQQNFPKKFPLHWTCVKSEQPDQCLLPRVMLSLWHFFKAWVCFFFFFLYSFSTRIDFAHLEEKNAHMHCNGTSPALIFLWGGKETHDGFQAHKSETK